MNKIFIHKEGSATLVMVMLPIGSYYENEEYKGISHFVEHMCFKGTPTLTRKDIDNAIEGVGGDINAFTDTEVTCYWAKVENKHKKIAIDVITDLATNPIFPKKEIDKEREVIIQELKMYKDSPSSSVGDLFNTIYYPKYCGFHHSIVGTEKSLYNITQTELKYFHNKYYQNPTLIVVGDVKDEQKDKLDTSMRTTNDIFKQKQNIYLEKRKIEQAHLIMGGDVYLPQYSKLDKFLMLKLLSLLFNGMSGRLFGKIREENNLVYTIRFDSTLWSGDTINWYIGLGLDKNKISKARKLIEKETSKTISKEELEKTIIKTIGTDALEREDIDNIAELVAYSRRKGVDWEKIYYDFPKQIRRVSSGLNDFLKDLNFKQNLMVGIVPK